jgi:two-component system response regulator YesN
VYRLLVVDDEDIITDSLAYMLETTPRIELDVYKAYSAVEALEYCRKSAFDIVVTDIQMPGMSGIELLKEIHKAWPRCQVIFLTGYDEFEYAYQAVQYHAVRYIFKTEGDEVLLDAIAECVTVIDQELYATELLSRAEDQMRRYLPIMRQSILRSLLTEEAPRTADTDADFKRLDIPLDLNRPVMLLAAWLGVPVTGDTAGAVDFVLRGKIGHAAASEIGWMGGDSIVWIIQPVHDVDFTHAQSAVKGMAESLQRYCSAVLRCKISFVFDSVAMDWAKLPSGFTRLKFIVANWTDRHSDIAIADIAYFLDTSSDGNKPDCQTHYQKSGDILTDRLLSYIRENLDKDLSLYTLSERVFLNPSYLSRRFKEVTGKNIADTIADLRVDKARRLLRETTCRINKIAALVGYEYPAHFTKMFKRRTGMTPQEYRDAAYDDAHIPPNVKKEQGM